MLSIVMPAYNEEKMISITTKTIIEIFIKEKIEFEIIYVDDGSKDATWHQIELAAKQNKFVKGLRFSRNFGKEAAMLAGLSVASGRCVAIIDCDLQHPPEVLVGMYHLWENGYQVIEGIKKSRGKESKLHQLSAKVFYNIMSKAVHLDMSKASDFKLMDRVVVDAIISMPERNTFFRALSSWVGFKTTSIEFEVQERIVGESKWSTWSLIKYAIRNITGFSSAPLHLVTVSGFLSLMLAFIVGIQSLIKYFLGYSIEGFTTVILLILIIGSFIMISLGIIGLYISKIYEEIKGRPRYLVSQTTNLEV